MTLALASKLQTKAGIVAIGGVAGVTALAGGAYAAWLVSGSGTVTGTSASIEALTVTSTITGSIFPGSLNPVSLTVNNPNVFPVSVTGVSFGAVTSSSPTDCPATNLVLTAPTSLALSVPAGASQSTSLPGAATMLSAAPTGCAGVTFTLTATVSGASV